MAPVKLVRRCLSGSAEGCINKRRRSEARLTSALAPCLGVGARGGGEIELCRHQWWRSVLSWAGGNAVMGETRV